MTTLTLTLPAGFANGVGNTMDPAHIATPLSEIETWMQAQLGRDGVTTDNFSGDEKVRGLNFQRNGLTEVFSRKELDRWSVAPSTYGTGAGKNPSPLPGGSLRFYLRANAVALGVLLTARQISSGSLSDTFECEGYLDDVFVAEHRFSQSGTTSTDRQVRLAWGTTTGGSILAGWHEVKHLIRGVAPTFNQFGCDSVDLTIIAAYK